MEKDKLKNVCRDILSFIDSKTKDLNELEIYTLCLELCNTLFSVVIFNTREDSVKDLLKLFCENCLNVATRKKNVNLSISKVLGSVKSVLKSGNLSDEEGKKELITHFIKSSLKRSKSNEDLIREFK